MSKKQGKKDFPGQRHNAPDGYDGMDDYNGFNDPSGLMAYDMQDYSTRQSKPTPDTEILPFYDVKYDNGPDKK